MSCPRQLIVKHVTPEQSRTIVLRAGQDTLAPVVNAQPSAIVRQTIAS